MAIYRMTPQERMERAKALSAQRKSLNELAKYRQEYTKQEQAQEKARQIAAEAEAKERENEDTHWLLRSLSTVGDLGSNILSGALKGVEGVVDAVAGLGGAVGGIFSEDIRNGVRDFIKYDAAGTWVGDPLEELFSDSYLKEDGIIEGVAGGVGQMLPAVLVTIATAGAGAPAAVSQAASLATTAVSAGGSATEEAYQDGAEYYEGLGYGAASGLVEAGTEKMFGGLTKGLHGAGFLDNLGKKAVKESAAKAGAKVGAQRVIKGMLEEGGEEAFAELANPALKTIYKGTDALKEYGEGDYWKGVGEAAIVGGLTSAAYGGTLGRLKRLGGGTSLDKDAAAVTEDIEELTKERARLAEKGKLTPEKASNIAKTIKADMELLEKQMQKASPKKRAELLKNGLGDLFDENGNLADAHKQKLDRDIASATDMTYDIRYRSADLDADTITKALGNNTAFSGEMSAEEAANYQGYTQMVNAMSKKSGGRIKTVIANSMQNDNAYVYEDTQNKQFIIVMGADQFKNGNAATELAKAYIGTAAHEGAHTTEGTYHGIDLDTHLKSNDGVLAQAMSDYLSRGYSKEYLGEGEGAKQKLLTLIEKRNTGVELTADEQAVLKEYDSESYAFAAQNILGNEHFAKQLVKDDLNLVERILNKISDIKEALKNRNDTDAKKAAEFVRTAEQMYIEALREVGANFINGKVAMANREEEETESEGVAEWQSRIGVYSEEERSSILRSPKNTIANSIDDIREFIQNTPKESNFLFVGKVGANTIAKIQTVSKVSSEDLSLVLHSDEVRHMIRQHGNEETEQKRGQIAVSEKNIDLIVGTVMDPDGIEKSTDSSGTVSLIFRKDINGKVTAVTVLSQKKKSLTLKSAWITKEKQHISPPSDVQAPNQTPNRELSMNAVSNDSISQTDEKSTLSAEKNSSTIHKNRKAVSEVSGSEVRKITINMSDEERAKILRAKAITLCEVTLSENFDIDINQLQRNMKSSVEKQLLGKLRDLGLLTTYKADPVDVEFEFTGGGVRKSMNSQISYYGGNLLDFAKVAMNITPLLNNSVLIEIHSDKAKGTPRENPRLVKTYVLLSAFREKTAIPQRYTITPVQFEIKQYVDNNNRLYLAVALTKIETSVMGDTELQNEARTRLLPVSNISIADLISKINPKDENFFKYVPNAFLDESQRKAKESALEKEAVKYGRDSKVHSSLKSDPNTEKVTVSKDDIENLNQDYPTEEISREIRKMAIRENLEKFEEKPTYTNSSQYKKKTKGQYAYSEASRNRKKVYTKKDAQNIISDIVKEELNFGDFYGTLNGKKREYVIDWLWETLNSSKPGERAGVANNIAEYIIQTSVLEDIYEEDSASLAESMECIELLKPYLHKLNLDNIKGEIKHRYGKDNSPYLLWAKKQGETGIGADAIAIELNKSGFSIDSSNEAEIFFHIHDAYREAVAELKKETKQSLNDSLSRDQRNQAKQKIIKSILRGFDTMGEASRMSQKINEYDTKIKEYDLELAELKKDLKEKDAKHYIQIADLKAEFKEEYKNTTEQNKLCGRVLSLAQKFKDRKYGAYVNASRYKTDIFKHSIEELARIQFRGNFNKAGTRKIIAGLNEWYNKDHNSLYSETNENSGIAGRFNNEISDMLDYLATNDGSLSTDELLMLEKVMQYFLHEMDNYNTVIKNGKRVEAKPLAEEYIRKAKLANEIKIKCGVIRLLSRNQLSIAVSDPATLMRQADSYMSGFFTEMFEEMREGEISSAVNEMELTEEFQEFWQKNKEYRKRYNEAKIHVNGHEISLGDAMSLYMSYKRKHAQAGLIYSGFDILDGDKKTTIYSGTDEEFTEKGIRKIAEERATEISSQFTAEDRKLISIMERAMEECRKLKIYVDMALQGYTNVDNNDYYWPIRRSQIATNVDLFSMFEGDRVTSLSMNKDTVKGAKNALVIEPAHIVFMRHIKATSLYSGLGIFTDNFNRLFNLNINDNFNRPETIKSTLEGEKFPAAMVKYFKEIKKDIEGISTKEQSMSFFNDAIKFIRSTYAKYQLGANPKVWLTQFSSFIAASNILDYSSIVKGFGVKNKRKDVDKYCKLAWLRNVDNMAVKAQTVTDKIGKVGDVLMKPIGMVDRLVVTNLFGACQAQVEKDQKLAIGTEENKKAAGKLLQKVILETQQNSLASERSAMMRSSNDIWKSLTMFSADGLKVISRYVDAFGEREVLRTLIKNEEDPKKKAAYETRLKEVNKTCAKAIGALVATAVFNALLARAFKWWYKRDEEETLVTFGVDVFGNMIGGLPVLRDIYSFFLEGYEMDNFMISTFNDVLTATADSFAVLMDALSGKDVSEQQIAGAIRKVVYAAGQMSGIPTRNAYNVVTGNINRFSPSTGYKIDSVFYSKNYNSDLKKAIEAEDEDMIATITGLMLNENVGDIQSEAARKEMDRLVSSGYDVIPRGVSDTVTYNGEQYTLNAKQKKTFTKVYNLANDTLADLVKLLKYKEAEDSVKAKAINFVYTTYYNLALQDFLGEDFESKNVLFAEAVDIEKLALIVSAARALEADVDKKGNTVSGSRKRKIQAYINSLNLKAAQKYMIMGYLGYSNVNGEGLVRAYINRLNLTKAEKQKLFEYSGYSS